MEIEDHVAGTFLAGADVIGVDAPTGLGIDELRAALDRLLAVTPTAADRDRPRLWVDRSFAAKGSGTVVTGTLAGGTLRVDDELLLLDGHKASRVRVRAPAEPSRRSQAEVGPGHRLAVNLTGVGARGGGPGPRPGPARSVGAHHDGRRITRGARPPSTTTCPGGAPTSSTSGRASTPVRLRVLGADALLPGGAGLVRLHLPVAAAAPARRPLRAAGERPVRDGRRRRDARRGAGPSRLQGPAVALVERVIAERGWVDVDDLDRLTGVRRAARPSAVGGSSPPVPWPPPRPIVLERADGPPAASASTWPP